MISIASLRKTTSKGRLNLLSRSWIRNRIGLRRSARDHASCRACWVEAVQNDLLSAQTRTFSDTFSPIRLIQPDPTSSFLVDSALTIRLLAKHGHLWAGCHAGGRGVRVPSSACCSGQTTLQIDVFLRSGWRQRASFSRIFSRGAHRLNLLLASRSERFATTRREGEPRAVAPVGSASETSRHLSPRISPRRRPAETTVRNTMRACSRQARSSPSATSTSSAPTGRASRASSRVPRRSTGWLVGCYRLLRRRRRERHERVT
jgi:hypothetical protein